MLLCSGRISSGLVFVLIHHGHRVALSGVDAQRNHFHPTREPQGQLPDVWATFVLFHKLEITSHGVSDFMH